MTRWRTRPRRATSAVAVEVGLASNDWQMPNNAQVLRALELTLPICHSRLISGMLMTYTDELGSPAFRLFNAVSIWARKVATEVMVDSLLVQASLAPISMVTYWTPWPTAVCAWPAMSTALAPLRASLKLRPLMAGLTAR